MVLQKLGPAAVQDVDLPWDSVKEALDHMAESSANYVDKEHLLVLWDALQVRKRFFVSQNEVCLTICIILTLLSLLMYYAVFKCAHPRC